MADAILLTFGSQPDPILAGTLFSPGEETLQGRQHHLALLISEHLSILNLNLNAVNLATLPTPGSVPGEEKNRPTVTGFVRC